MPESIERKECWTMQEVFEITERLLNDKCIVTIKQLGSSSFQSNAIVVTGKRNTELSKKWP